ncbi:MAG: DegV family protein [Clostridium sp.]|uniref:DegV family protein n=1 Tax=Clostridium culturomicium TaxID=1499683 RepID=UPI00058DC330|nr:DegV family protein [Clostridium culturomicium]MDU4892735.1 DegV family protein [Clostridium sp.]MDU7082060.1 DegV family protein [Clostridium sp.]
MEKIALITDSASDITKELVLKYNIKVLPFKIIYRDKEFSDGIDITSKEVYETLESNTPTTSLPSMAEIEGVFESLKAEGYTHAIAVTISSKLSGFNNAIKLLSEEYPEIKTYVHDSKSISKGEQILIEEAAKMIEAGKNFDEVVAELPKINERIKIFFVIGTLEYLIRGGRLGKVAGTIAQFLHLKPIVSVDEEGEYYTYAKVRGRKQSLHKIKDIGEDILNNKKCEVFLMHGEAEAETLELAEKFKENSNAVSVNFGGYLSPVSGVHSGPGFIGVLFYEKE